MPYSFSFDPNTFISSGLVCLALQTISDIKHIEGVDRIVWSEKIYDIKNNNINFINGLLGLES
jgi:hypothetical protein